MSTSAGGPPTRPTPVTPAGSSGGGSAGSGTVTAPQPAVSAPPPTRPIAKPADGGGAARAGAAAGGVAKPTAAAGSPAAPGKAGRPLRPGQPGPGAAGTRPTVRRVRLAVTRVDPWSAMKVSFLLSFAAAVGLVVMTGVLWMVLSGMSVFSDIDGLVRSLQPTTAAEPFTIMDYVAFPRMMALSMVIGVVDVILLTALGTIGAYLYNLTAALVGGVQLTLTDE